MPLVKNEIDVSLVIPCLNEAASLTHCIGLAKEFIEALKKLGLSGEIVVSDNGSTDGSPDIARAQGCRVVSCPQRGYGNALRYGIAQAGGKYIVMGDADGAHDFREAVPMVQKILDGYDFCMGSRFKGKILPGSMPWKNRYIGNPLLTGLLNIFFRSGLSDAHCGMRAFTKKAFEAMKLRSPGMEFASEMVVKATLLNLKRTEVPITHHPDLRGRPPHLLPWQDGWRHLKFLFLYSPLWLFLAPSLLMILLSSAIFIIVPLAPLFATFKIGPLSFGDHWMILASSLFSIGFQGMLLGVISLIYRVRNRIFPASETLKRLYKTVTIENVFLTGAGFILLGLIIFGSILVNWYQGGFHGLYKLREMVIVATCFIVGMQTLFSGLLLSIISDAKDASQ